MPRPYTINVISESAMAKGQGVHTAFVEHLEVLKHLGIKHVVNKFQKADIAHAHTIGLLFWLLAWRSRKKVFSAHVIPDSFEGSLRGYRVWGPLLNAYLKWTYNHADMVFGVSEDTVEELKKMGIKAELRCLPNAVNRAHFYPDPERRQQYRQQLGLQPDQKVVIDVGQVQPRKGFESFVNTAKAMPEVTFLWVGGRPFGKLTADAEKLDRVIAAAPPNFRLTGVVPLESMNGYYNAADALLFPSWQESFGLVVVEAAACGLPVLIRRDANYSSIFDQYTLTGNEADFAPTLQALFSDPQQYAHYQAASTQLAEQFSSEHQAKQLDDYYQSLLSD